MTFSPIFLIGARACGKSTVGRLLAELLGIAFEDTDTRIRVASGKDVAEIVTESGWPAFRALECEALRACACPDTVIATGGGIVLDPGNCEFMRENGVVIFLEAPVEALRARLLADPDPRLRPAFSGASAADEAARILQEREPLYRAAAHHRVRNEGFPALTARYTAELLMREA